MIHPNYNENRSPHMQILSVDQRFEIIQAAKGVLERTGCRIDHEEALALLKKSGAHIDGNRTRVPRHLVEQAISQAPKGILIYDRTGNPAMDLSGPKTYYGTSTASPRTRDALTGAVHPTRVEDIAIGAKVADALSDIDWVMPFGSSQDVPSIVAELYEFEAVVTNTTKPLAFCGYSARGVDLVFEMAAAVAGGKDQLIQKPFLLAYPEPISPLTYPKEVVDKMFLAAEWGIPQITTGAGQTGATSPVTLAGSLVQMVAEAMMSVLLIQLKKTGAPTFFAANFGMFDMRNTLLAMASPEASLLQGAMAQIARDFGLPSWGYAGTTDSKCLDAQAGIESAFTIFAQGLAGINLIHDVGYMDMGMLCSAEMLVMGNEVAGMVKQFMKGIGVTPETMACDVIDKAGPGGNYLQSPHTLKHFKECWYPELFCRSSYSAWQESGETTLADRCRAKVKKIVDSHQTVELDNTIKETISMIRKEGEKEILGS